MFELYLKLVSQVCFGIFLTALMFYLTGSGILYLIHLSIRTYKSIPAKVESMRQWRIPARRARRKKIAPKSAAAPSERVRSIRKVGGGSQ